MGVILHALLLEVPEVIETARLRLAATRAGRGPEILRAVAESSDELKQWMPWAQEAPSLEVAERHCREAQARWYAREELDFCFFRREDGTFVGKGSLHTIDWTLPRFEIGYWIRTSSARQGLATEATVGMAEMAATNLAACRLEILCDTRNSASRRVAEKSGFALEGVRRNSRRDVRGDLADSCMYARVP